MKRRNRDKRVDIKELEKLGAQAAQTGDYAGAHGFWQAAEHVMRSTVQSRSA